MIDWAHLAGLVESKIFAAWLGIVSQLIFSHGEPDYNMYIILPLMLIAFFCATSFVYAVDEGITSAFAAFTVMFKIALTYASALFGSMAVYRLFFHRLRKVCYQC
jgi:threonine/homoserine/homoserine lactone efflux protein